MDIAVVGAGFAGIATARVLLRVGHRVTVFDSAPDVGGVWSASRSYPGLSTQNTGSNHLSEHRYPEGTPTFPNGAQVREYLQAYVDRFALKDNILLRTQVVSAIQDPATKQWILTLRAAGENGQFLPNAPTTRQTYDRLIICNGVFSQPRIPNYAGIEDFTAAGGQIIHSSHFHDAEKARGKNVFVVGYGKSACDTAVAVADVAESTTVIARRLTWKCPRLLNGILPYQYLLLTRFAEALFLYKEPGPMSRLLHGPMRFVREGMLNTLGWICRRQCNLDANGLLPRSKFETIARADISLVTEGFFERIQTGRITVLSENEIVSVGAEDGRPTATLRDGESWPVDMIIAATGFRQAAQFLEDDVYAKCADANGNFVLYRCIEPVGVDNLYFNGYNSSLLCPSSAEAAALWIAEAIEGTLKLPPAEERKRRAQEWFDWLDVRSETRHAHGTNHAPFSLAVIDTVLNDIGVSISTPAYISQWLLPVDPCAYKPVADTVVNRILTRRAEKAKGH